MNWNYSSAIGQLLYLSSNTRPDIQFAVHQCARFSHSPKKSHGQAVKRICRYLAGTPNDGIKFSPNLIGRTQLLVWMLITLDCNNHEMIKHPVHESRTGFVQPLFGSLIWQSKLNRDLPQFNASVGCLSVWQ
jgi:hypothetical protein